MGIFLKLPRDSDVQFQLRTVLSGPLAMKPYHKERW